MSEYLYFIFHIHNPKSSLIREFCNTVQCSEETLLYELERLNLKLRPSNPVVIEKLRIHNSDTFEYLYKPHFKTNMKAEYYEARRMTIDCT